VSNLDTGERLSLRGDETFSTASLIKVPILVTLYDLAEQKQLATNLLLDRIVIRRVWQKMEALGLPHTKVHSKTFLRISSMAMDSSVKYGLGVSTPNEMARLFELLAVGKAVSPAADSAMLDLLSKQCGQRTDAEKHRIVARTPQTGATDSVRTECALFRLQSRVVACGFTKQNADTRWVVDNEAQVSLGKLGSAIVAAWPRR
jgi:beta-lactamase class A